jgi:Spy/CpxP family protein refolding chaperone
MKFNLSYLLGVLLITPLCSEAWSSPPPQEPQLVIAGRRKSKEPELFKSLNLSTSQVNRMQEIRQKYKNRIEARHKDLRQAYRELQRLMAGNGNASQIRVKHNQVQNLQNQLGNLRLESLLEMRSVLTPIQRQKLAQIMAKRGFMRPSH